MLRAHAFSERLRESAICQDLASLGYAILPQFLFPSETRPLLEMLDRLWAQKALKPAQIGQGQEKIRLSELRGDFILWLNRNDFQSLDQVYFPLMDAVAELLNQRCFLGLRDFETHFTLYPAMAGYKKHQDRFKSNNNRVLTSLVYLNQEWKNEDGGALILHREQGPVQILPTEGTLVVFLSEMWHEVKPAFRERKSLTGWFLQEKRLY